MGPIILKNYNDLVTSTEIREGLRQNANFGQGNMANLKASIDDLDLDDDGFKPEADPFAAG